MNSKNEIRKKKIEDLLLTLKLALDKNDLRLIKIINVELHSKLQNYIRFYGGEDDDAGNE